MVVTTGLNCVRGALRHTERRLPVRDLCEVRFGGLDSRPKHLPCIVSTFDFWVHSMVRSANTNSCYSDVSHRGAFDWKFMVLCASVCDPQDPRYCEKKEGDGVDYHLEVIRIVAVYDVEHHVLVSWISASAAAPRELIVVSSLSDSSSNWNGCFFFLAKGKPSEEMRVKEWHVD